VFCGEKVAKILTIFFQQYLFIKEPKSLMSKKVKRTSKLWQNYVQLIAVRKHIKRIKLFLFTI